MNHLGRLISNISFIKLSQDYKYIIIYLMAINLINFMFFAVDKRNAIKNKWRIAESVLLGLSFIGGSIGGLLAMKICRHKTKKARFSIGLPVILLIHIIIILYILTTLI